MSGAEPAGVPEEYGNAQSRGSLASTVGGHDLRSLLIVFLDTEFTELASDARLLSIGIASEGGLELYAEVIDPDRIASSSRFVREVVLSQFGRVNGAACTYLELGHRVADFLSEMALRAWPGEWIDVAYESEMDWSLLIRALGDAGIEWRGALQCVRPMNIRDQAGSNVGRSAARAYFKAQKRKPLSRHHSLCDARALRAAFAACDQLEAPVYDVRPRPDQEIFFR